MVPNVTHTGTSFKGAFAYYLHDKRQEGEEATLTRERVEWTDTRNLMTDDPDTAMKIMIATAQDRNRLKAEAGVKSTGQKSDKTVYAYSLAWHPDEAGQISKAEMLRAADESLLAIGAQNYQAVIVAHNDEPQPHIHVLINRTSMENGKLLTIGNDWRKLDAWALSYRQARGQEHLYCPARAEKADAVKRKGQGEDVDYMRGEKSTPRHMADDLQTAKAASNDNRPELEKDRQAKLDSALGSESREMRDRHKSEWTDLSERYSAKKEQIYTHAKSAIDKAKTQITEQYRPAYRTMYRRHHQTRLDHKERDQHLMGKLRNVFAALKHKKISGLEDGDRGWLASAFTFVWSRRARFDALDRSLKAELQSMRKEERQVKDAAVKAIQDDRKALLSSARKTFGSDRSALIDKQRDDKVLMRGKWKRRNEERKRAFGIIAKSAEVKREAKKEQRPKSAMKQEKMRGEQRTAAKGRKGGGRSRSRSRTRSKKGDS